MMASKSTIRVCGKRFNKTLRRLRDEGTPPSREEIGYVRAFRGSEWSLMDFCVAEDDIPAIGLLTEAGADIEITRCTNAETMRLVIGSVQTPENATSLLRQGRAMMSEKREPHGDHSIMVESLSAMVERFETSEAVRDEHVLFNVQLDPASARDVDNALGESGSLSTSTRRTSLRWRYTSSNGSAWGR